MKGVRAGQRGVGEMIASPAALGVSVFATPLGYWALAGRDQTLFAITVGHADANSAANALRTLLRDQVIDAESTDWYPELRQRLERYVSGERVDFHDVKLHLEKLTQFQQVIVDTTRQLKHGETITYGDLAARANRPRAARAVGTVMSSNRFPIIIPCHRVIGAGGAPGGYSAPSGVTLKTRLLELEGQ